MYYYLDQYKTLHCSKNLDTAIKAAKYNKRVIDKDIPGQHGWPYLDGIELTMESADKIYIQGNSKEGKAVDSAQYPALKSLYEELLKG